MSNAVPNSWKVMLMKGQSAGLTDTFKLILMQPGFVFNKDTMHAYADVLSFELPTANGYTVGGVTLSGVAITVNNTNDSADMTWSNVTITASGGSLLLSGAIIYNDSTATGSGDDYTDAITSYKDAGGTITIADGTPLVISSIGDILGDKI
mgnify:CR=1 FL=1